MGDATIVELRVTEIVTGGPAMVRFDAPQKEAQGSSALAPSLSGIYSKRQKASGGHIPPHDDRADSPPS